MSRRSEPPSAPPRGSGKEASVRRDDGWRELLAAPHLATSVVLSAGVGLFAVNGYIATTIQPSVTAEIGGLALYAWTTTMYVLAALIGSTTAAALLSSTGPRIAYRVAAGVLAVGTLMCATAPSMLVLLAGRMLQGLGGGLLFALSYIVVKLALPERLWPRAMALVSAMFGLATVVGPAMGGAFAQWGSWRLSFWVLVPAIAVFAWGAGRLPRLGRATEGTAVAVGNIAILSTGVVVISVASASRHPLLNGIGIAAALACVGVWIRRERAGPSRLLPVSTFGRTTPLRWYYVTMALLAFATMVDVFIPYFGQTLQGLDPISAGYLAAVMSAGWTVASIASSGSSRPPATLMRIAPFVSATGLALLIVFAPVASGFSGTVLAVGFGLTLLGAGVGMGWPHLLTAILVASDDEKGGAGASITTVQMVAQAFGAATAGLVTNVAGLLDPGGVDGTQSAARWLFVSFLIVPGIAAWSVRKATITSRRELSRDEQRPIMGSR